MPFNDNELLAARAFERQSGTFDAQYGSDEIIRYKRQRVRAHVMRYVRPGSRILELNCGTGADALWLARQGMKVHATDISPGMIEKLQQKIMESPGCGVSSELCSFTRLDELKDKGPYDMIFSNFAGLNCTLELEGVLSGLSGLLTKNGIVTLVLLPPFCLWESALIFRGKFKTATRRIFHRHIASATVEGISFACRYYAPSRVVKMFGPAFRLLTLEGLCTLVPPSYLENFAEKHAKWYAFLKACEARCKDQWPWKYMGDYYILSLQRNTP